MTNVPTCPVPQPCQEKNDHNIGLLPQEFFTLAGELKGDEKVCAKPVREGHVPAPPEIADAAADIRKVEIFREAEPQHLSQPDRHIGVAGKIAINLHGVAIGCHKIFKTSIAQRVIENTIDKVYRQVIGDNHFFY